MVKVRIVVIDKTVLPTPGDCTAMPILVVSSDIMYVIDSKITYAWPFAMKPRVYEVVALIVISHSPPGVNDLPFIVGEILAPGPSILSISTIATKRQDSIKSFLTPNDLECIVNDFRNNMKIGSHIIQIWTSGIGVPV
jgi:hypothetical protein